MEISMLHMLLNMLEPKLLRPRFKELYVFYLQKYIVLQWSKMAVGVWGGVYVCGFFQPEDSRGSFKVRYTGLEEKKKVSRPCEGDSSPQLQSMRESQD